MSVSSEHGVLGLVSRTEILNHCRGQIGLISLLRLCSQQQKTDGLGVTTITCYHFILLLGWEDRELYIPVIYYSFLVPVLADLFTFPRKLYCIDTSLVRSSHVTLTLVWVTFLLALVCLRLLAACLWKGSQLLAPPAPAHRGHGHLM